jgi:ribosomal protein S6
MEKQLITKIQKEEWNRQYIVTIIMKSNIGEEENIKQVKIMMESIPDTCEVLNIKNCGKKILTYPIRKQDTGFYITMQIKLEDNDQLKTSLEEISRKLKSLEDILKFLIVRIPDVSHMLADNLYHMKSFIHKTSDPSFPSSSSSFQKKY